ncbi:hypothetical protein HRH25_23515 [Flavisolibacter sp. BT320]|nr:hypothetical protein [Flavisolibacter longurius]
MTMQRCSITVIATRHQENGQCTSNELYRIIERIAPDVIFEEIPSSKFDAVYKGLRQPSLEVQTIKRYLQSHPIPHFPVDLDIDEVDGFFMRSDFKTMSYIFVNYSSEYQRLYNQRQFLANNHGFPYLNSNEWTMLSERMDVLEQEVIKKINNEKLSQRAKEWFNENDVRENEMIKNIYSYVENNRYEKGLFLVGVEHRRKLMDKILDFEKNHHLKIKWNFNYFNQ